METNSKTFILSTFSSVSIRKNIKNKKILKIKKYSKIYIWFTMSITHHPSELCRWMEIRCIQPSTCPALEQWLPEESFPLPNIHISSLSVIMLSILTILIKCFHSAEGMRENVFACKLFSYFIQNIFPAIDETLSCFSSFPHGVWGVKIFTKTIFTHYFMKRCTFSNVNAFIEVITACGYPTLHVSLPWTVPTHCLQFSTNPCAWR